MKKFIVLSALVAATSTAFVACSSDDDLAQQPKAPETIVDNGSSQGTPFSVKPSSGATRATLFNSDAWDGTNNTYVNCFKLFGRQGTAEPWVKNVVFTRNSKSANWIPARDDDGDVASLTWPTDNPATTEVVESEITSDFYAITDNAIKGQAYDNELDGVTKWMNPVVGKFTYTLPTEVVNIPWEDKSNPGALTIGYLTPSDPDYDENSNVTIIKNTDLKDLMVATASHKESDPEVDEGALPLTFKHALASLTIKAKFQSDGEYDSKPEDNGWAKVKAVAVCGLNTSCTYTFGTGWGATSTPVNYYYEFAPVKFDVEEEDNTDPTIKTLVPAGQWLVIPQETTPCSLTYTNALPTTGAYVILKIEEFNNEGTDFFLFYPLQTTFNAGKNRTIVIDIAQCRDYSYDTTPADGKCDLYFEPSTVFGGARVFEMEE